MKVTPDSVAPRALAYVAPDDDVDEEEKDGDIADEDNDMTNPKVGGDSTIASDNEICSGESETQAFAANQKSHPKQSNRLAPEEETVTECILQDFPPRNQEHKNDNAEEPALSILAAMVELPSDQHGTASEATKHNSSASLTSAKADLDEHKNEPEDGSYADHVKEDSPKMIPSKEIFYLDKSSGGGEDSDSGTLPLVVNTALGGEGSQYSLDSEDITDDEDDGEGFLKPVKAISPQTPVRFVSAAVKLVENGERFGTYKTSSLVLDRSMRMESALQLGGGRVGSLILSSSGGLAALEDRSKTFGVDKTGRRIEVPLEATTATTGSLVGSVATYQMNRGSITYGSSSQNYSGPHAGIAQRSLSFADERGQDLARVTEVHDTHYALSRGFLKRYISGQCAIFLAMLLFCICIAVPMVFFVVTRQKA
ncbi:Hypothetical Protein FCC1311_015892 [Hondaea fermentalgiana]|uniref:Uncharacterized protein n=1 Tax=Hondaea fermentalgiana TaxID=2315210 RepID=A0A2R5GB87_9STRA|nr:Hypothetical Protein FCC1311_015892 [Hondaea fermentalgiana]|eukprot:GBG25371.1 Hypothetical Protein FCC1311_015892 [Hondaea fermentalgiana]